MLEDQKYRNSLVRSTVRKIPDIYNEQERGEVKELEHLLVLVQT